MTYPTANGVSRTLGRRHKRSESHGTRVRGYRSKTAGFTVTGTERGSKRTPVVLVEHVLSTSVHDRNADYSRIVENAIDGYADTLQRAGYLIEATYEGISSRIIVTGKEA